MHRHAPSPTRDSGYLRQWIVAIPLLLILLAFLINNTAQLNQVLVEDAHTSVEDTATQIDDDATFRLAMFESYVEDVANGLSNADPARPLDQLLASEQTTTLFDCMYIVNSSFEIVASTDTTENVTSWMKGIDAFPAEPAVFFYNQIGLAFTAPISRGDTTGLTLVGIRLTSGTGPFFSDKNYLTSGFSALVDNKGNLVAPACGVISDDLRASWKTEPVAGFVQQAIEAVSDNTSHTAVELRDVSSYVDGSGYIAASALDVNDWVLVTYVPESVFAERASTMLSRYQVAIGLCVVSFVIVLIGIWRGHRHSLERVRDALFIDPLTGGKTVAAFEDAARRIVAEAAPGTLYVLHLDIVGFKDLSERIGAKAADQLLVQVARALESEVDDVELAARGDRDCFFVLLRERDDAAVRERIKRMCDRIHARVAPAAVSTVDLAWGACMQRGRKAELRVLEDHAIRAAEFCTPAEPCVFYSHDLELRLARRFELERTFSEALERGDFEVHFQPKVCLSCSCHPSAEALVRWRHPEYGMISPGEFIPLLEHNRRIYELDRYVFERVCRIMAGWQRTELADVTVSVNLSRVGLVDHGLSVIYEMAEIKQRYGIPDRKIEIEVTESVANDAHLMEVVRSAVPLMRRHGFRCSLDDFGFGYSSLATLKDFEMDAVKLDRHFFIDANEKCWQVVGAFIELAHALGLDVVAEGVEDPDQVERLRDLGCDAIQGFVFARPMPRAEFETWSQHFRAERAQRNGMSVV